MKTKKIFFTVICSLTCLLGHFSSYADNTVWFDEIRQPCSIYMLTTGGDVVEVAGTTEFCLTAPWSLCFPELCQATVVAHPIR